MIKMNEEELNDIQELIERKLLMAEVMGGLTSHDKKFINLWNYTIQLQNNWNELKKWLESWLENDKHCYLAENPIDKCRCEVYKELLNKMQELEQGKDE